jgi:hypothetical protein
VSLAATYDQANAVVELTVDGLQTASAAIASIERSTDGATWTGVRGAVDFVVTGDTAEVYLDYEYTAGPGVTNFYRVVGRDQAQFIGVGTASDDDGASFTISPSLPVGVQAGDLMVLFVEVYNTSGSTINENPSGWTLVGRSPGYLGNDDFPVKTSIYMRVAVAGDIAPTIEINQTGGAQSHNAIAQIAAFRNVRPVSLGAARSSEAEQPASTTQIRFPALDVVENFALVIAFAASGVEWTSVAAPSPFTIIDDPIGASSTSAIAWAYDVRGDAGVVPSDVFTLTGGSHPETTKRGWTAAFSYDSINAPSSVLFTDDVDTPLDVVWLKDPLRPARNMIVEVASPTQIRHASRSGLFDIKGRAEPIEVSEIRRARAWTQRWVFQTFDELDAMLELFASGRTLLLHVPARGTLPDCPPWPRSLPGGYIAVGEVSEETAPDAPLPGTLTAPVQIVAAPCADLVVCEPEETSP